MKNQKAAPVREVVGIFSETGHLHRALDELLAAGYEHESLGLLTGERTVEKELSDYYATQPGEQDDSAAPRTAFVRRESVGDTVHALLGNLFFVGTTTAAGAAVITAGVLGGALLPAIAGAAAVGAVGAVVGRVIHQSDAEYLEEQVEAGRILLFVRVQDQAAEKLATEILSKHCDLDVKAITVKPQA